MLPDPLGNISDEETPSEYQFVLGFRRESHPKRKPVERESPAPYTSVIKENLKELYPHVREKWKISFPERWDKTQASSLLEINSASQGVAFKKSSPPKEAAACRANAPIPPCAGLYYFEVSIIQANDGCMGIGISKKECQLNRMPGWDSNSYGYHGDDGNFFSASGHGTPYGPRFGTGDTVGCGVDTLLRHIFFTKNGEHLGVAYEGMESVDDLYPTIGMQMSDEEVTGNFGEKPFMFNIAEHREKLQKERYSLIENVRMPEDVPIWINSTVGSFLAYAGAHKTLQTFSESAKLDLNPDKLVKIQQRKEIYDEVMNGGSPLKVRELLKSYFPTVLKDDSQITLLITCLRFYNIARKIEYAQPAKCGEKSRDASLTNVVGRVAEMSDGEKQGPSTSLKDDNGCPPGDIVFEYDAESNKKTPEEEEKELKAAFANDIEFRRAEYLMKLGGKVMELSLKEEKLDDVVRKIIQITLESATDPENCVMEEPYRKYIANRISAAIHKHEKTPPCSELTRMFHCWRGLVQNMGKDNHQMASLCGVRQMILADPVEPDTLQEPEKMETEKELEKTDADKASDKMDTDKESDKMELSKD